MQKNKNKNKKKEREGKRLKEQKEIRVNGLMESTVNCGKLEVVQKESEGTVSIILTGLF